LALGNVPRASLAGAGPVELRLSGESLLVHAGFSPEAFRAFVARYPVLAGVTIEPADAAPRSRGFVSFARVPLAAPLALAAGVALPLAEREINPPPPVHPSCHANLRTPRARPNSGAWHPADGEAPPSRGTCRKRSASRK
jgi:hypothetical protein